MSSFLLNVDLSARVTIYSVGAPHRDTILSVKKLTFGNVRGLNLKTLVKCPLSDEGEHRSNYFFAWPNVKR